MQKEITLWATRKGQPSYMEDLITSTTDTAKLAKAKQWALDNGFDRLREACVIDGREPDFSKTVNL